MWQLAAAALPGIPRFGDVVRDDIWTVSSLFTPSLHCA
jgi:hypothetical protein